MLDGSYCQCGAGARGEGDTPLYKLYRYVPPQRVWFLSRFGLKTGIYFDHYGLKSGMVFKGTTGAYERLSFQLQMNSERKRSIQNVSFELNFTNS